MLRFCSSLLSKIPSPFLPQLLNQILKEVYITVSFCKRAAFIVVSKRFRAKCRLVFIKHVANSKKIKMYDKFTMFLYIYGQFAVNHEGECSNCYPKKKKRNDY